jgi:predicted ATPase
MLDRSVVLAAIDGLVAKSMVATRPIGAMMRYRLLDTTRAYALDIGIDDLDAADLAVRHAAYYRRWLEQAGEGDRPARGKRGGARPALTLLRNGYLPRAGPSSRLSPQG